jgi:hypothetical protein
LNQNKGTGPIDFWGFNTVKDSGNENKKKRYDHIPEATPKSGQNVLGGDAVFGDHFLSSACSIVSLRETCSIALLVQTVDTVKSLNRFIALAI